MSPDPFLGARVKIERAKRHVQEIAAEVSTFLAQNPYSVVMTPNHGVGQRQWKVRIRSEIPDMWAGIIGDVIHNARASLDHMMVAAVKICDPGRVSYNHVHFVIRKSKDEFETDLGKNIKGASPGVRLFVEGLKPYKGGNEAFWRLHRLDIIDKHRGLVPVGAAHSSIGLNFDTQAMAALLYDPGEVVPTWPTMPPLVLTPADRQFPLKDGAVIFSAPIERDQFLKDEIQFSFEIAFGEGQVLDSEPILPALYEVCNFVEGVGDSFSRYFQEGGR